MNIDDARSQRRDLERQIVDMILEFERDTGLSIAGIFLNRTAIRLSCPDRIGSPLNRDPTQERPTQQYIGQADSDGVEPGSVCSQLHVNIDVEL